MRLVLELDADDPTQHRLKRPAWWCLYVIALLLVSAVGAMERYLPDGPMRTVLECSLVILAFGLMLVWRRCNRARWA